MSMNDSQEYVTLPFIRELLATQERSFKSMVELFFESVKNEVKEVRSLVTDLKESLLFTQKDVDDTKFKIESLNMKLNKVEDDLNENYTDIEQLYDNLENLENHSRRNNVKIFGIPEKPEKDGPELWEHCESAVRQEIESKLKIKGRNMAIERAHRVGRRHAPTRHLLNGTKVKSRPRPIVVKFLLWKDKEKVIKAARTIKPKEVQFLEDFSQRTLDRRREIIPKLIEARKNGKRAFLVKDQIVYKNRPPTDHEVQNEQ